MDKKERQNNSSKNKDKNFTSANTAEVITLIILFTAIIVGGLLYFFQNKTTTDTLESVQNSYETRVEGLEKQVDKLETQVSEAETNNQQEDSESEEEEVENTQETDNQTTAQAVQPSANDFFENGNLLDSGDKFLYDQPGAPASEVNLVYTNMSFCIDGQAICDPRFLAEGKNIFLVGKKVGNTVTVSFMEVL